MVLTDNEIEKILIKHQIKKDTYGLIKYSDEIVQKSKKEFGNILNRTSIIQIIQKLKEEGFIDDNQLKAYNNVPADKKK